MRNRYLIILMISFIISSCNTASNTNLKDSSRLKDSVPIATKVVAMSDSLKSNDTTILFYTERLYLFSDLVEHDKFTLTLKGKSIIDGQITFEIFSHTQSIHSEIFPAYDLLWDEGDVIPTTKQKCDTIITRMKSFFSDNSFIHPAISIAKPFDADMSDKEIWEEINADKNADGFVYTHGYEGTYAIAYSKKKKKVVTYFSSD